MTTTMTQQSTMNKVYKHMYTLLRRRHVTYDKLAADSVTPFHTNMIRSERSHDILSGNSRESLNRIAHVVFADCGYRIIRCKKLDF